MNLKASFVTGAKIAAILSALYYANVAATATAIYKYEVSSPWTRFSEQIFPYPAAIVNSEIIPLARFRQEVAARQSLAAKNNIEAPKREVEKSVINRLVTRVLYAETLREHNYRITESDVDKSLDTVYQQIGGKENLAAFLKEEYGDQIELSDFRVLTREFLTQSAIEKELLVHAVVRHILIAVPEGANETQVGNALKKANEVKGKITDINAFGEMAKQYSEDLASRDKGGDLGTTTRGEISTSFSPDFENALFTLPVGQVSEPVRSRHGWHLIVVDKREGAIDKSLDALTAELRTQATVRLFVGR
ncbi:MAG: PpiC-type peptidyl-prolyl cis-trans isomerase [Patescibacteria group bacterium]|jgi:parvulin-like peptidyl-prolyl isomerase|nr:PpiC-type peptidyl-prolyl cis-trans isomerase [Patescibacteria group bacterium]